MTSEQRSPWDAPETVGGFVRSPPNQVLMEYASAVARAGGTRVVDVGCGAARNAVPLAEIGWDVFGIDFSSPMLDAAQQRARDAGVASRVRLVRGAMRALPFDNRCFDLVVAHGIWNLARTAAEFRAAVAEAARVARPGAALFVFTFSRHTLPAAAEPVPGEPFAYTQFSGQPQTFLTDAQLVSELAAFGFRPDDAVPLREYNRSATERAAGPPVIYEAAFRLLG